MKDYDNPVVLSYCHPMRLITKPQEKVTFSLDEINKCSYNNYLLCRIVGSIENTYRGTKVTYLVCGDGALAIGKEHNLTINQLLLHYNDLLCKLLFGGVDVEGITSKDIATGYVKDEKMVWPVNFGHSYNSHLHACIRMKLTTSFDAIVLHGASESSISISEFRKSLLDGTEITDSTSNLSTYHLIQGITEMKYGNWSSAVTNLWIVAEQITDCLWEREYVNCETRDPEISGRRQTLLQDHRTYSASVKQELLYQIGLLPKETYRRIYRIRKARNKLIHEGIMVEKEDAHQLYQAIDELLGIVINNKGKSIMPTLRPFRV
ncbi:MAG: hypothetical protein E7320_06980 [Clostridiales bacterium]|nr:hypothetical protein [Clostridiales bacterium]